MIFEPIIYIYHLLKQFCINNDPIIQTASFKISLQVSKAPT